MTKIGKYKTRWNKYPRASYFAVYTILFGLMCLFVFIYFALYRKSFIFKTDGLPQHANALAYYGEYLRDIFKTLFTKHKLEIPIWDMNIGYGSDIITTLHYYIVGDPLALTAVLVPKQYTEFLYIFLILLRFYLAGLSFSMYCIYHKHDKIHVLMGAMVYCFSGYALYAGIRHPYFINPMIYLPIILIGIDKIFEKKKPFIFIFSVFLAAISNFYFFYMISIFMFIYAIFRYIIIFKKVRLKELMPWIFKFIGFYLVGLCMSCVVFLPVAASALGSGRIAVERSLSLFYDRKYYEKLLVSFVSGRAGHWSVISFSPIVLIAVFIMFIKKKDNRHLVTAFMLLTLFICIPFFGKALNGFSYAANRWIWAYAALNAYILVKMAPYLFSLSKNEKNKLIILTAVYVTLCIVLRGARESKGISSVMLMIVLLLLLLMDLDILGKAHVNKLILLTMACIGIIWNSYNLYSVNIQDYLSSFIGLNDFSRLMFNDMPSDLVKNLDDDGVFRYSQYATGESYNSSMQQKLNSTTYYFSLSNKYISEYFNELYINYPLEQKYNGLDQRTILNTLASVKYYLIKDGYEKQLPHTFFKTQKIDEGMFSDSTYSLYQGRNTLPIGYTYDNYINREVYEQLSATEKQMALIQGCVLEESSFNEVIPVFDDEIVDFTFSGSKDVIIEDGKIIVNKKNASIELNFTGIPKSETYIIFENLKVEGINPIDSYSKEEWDSKTVYKQQKEIRANTFWTAAESFTINAVSGKINKSIVSVTDRNNSYSGKKDYLCNMGYTWNPISSIKLTFPNKGIYTFDDLRIVCQPVTGINTYVDKLKEATLEDVVISTNKITGTIKTDNPKILLLSIPYSEGWSVIVDGKASEIKRANTMFMAVELGSGIHQVQFSYVTPYIKEGTIVSLIGFMIVVGIWVYYRKSRRFVSGKVDM